MPPVSVLLVETLRGKSLHRTLQNVAGRQLTDVPLTGLILDMAASRRPGNYRRFLRQESPRWVSLDLDAGSRPHVAASMNGTLPFRDDSFDGAVFYNALYIAEEPSHVLQEIHRVLKPGGRLLLAAPTIFEETPEPHDYWRFTGDGLERLLFCAGFDSTRTVRFGGRWTTAAYVLTPFLRPLILRAFVHIAACWLDRLAARFGRRMRIIPIGHVVLATKARTQ